MKLRNAAHRITVVERNKPFDTFGWGVVLSDQTLGNLQEADPATTQSMAGQASTWLGTAARVQITRSPIPVMDSGSLTHRCARH